MGINKLYDLKNGFTADYWNIGSIKENKTHRNVNVTLCLFKDITTKNLYPDNSLKILNIELSEDLYPFDLDIISPIGETHYRAIYNKIKEIGNIDDGTGNGNFIDFSSATNVLESFIKIIEGTNLIVPSITTHDFEDITSGQSSGNITFTIKNIGDADLNLTGGTPIIDISGTDADQFTVGDPSSILLALGESTTFTISFNPTSTGIKDATISIDNDDGGRNPFTFDVTGTGI